MSSESRTSELEDASLSSRKLARLRIDNLNVDDGGSDVTLESDGCYYSGLGNELSSMLQETLSYSAPNLAPLLRILKILENVIINDETLSEEIYASKGFRGCLQKIINLKQIGENEDIRLKAIHGLAAAIEKSLLSTEFSGKVDPFTCSQLKRRLPLVFGKYPESQHQSHPEIMIHQVTSEKETETHDTGYVMWPSSVILARLISDNESLFLDCGGEENCDVLELGAGCGLVGLTAAALIQRRNEEQRIRCEESKEDFVHNNLYNNASVIFTDYLPAVLENIERNISLNDFDDGLTKVTGLDFFDQPGNYDSEYDSSQPNWIDMTGAKQSQVQVVLAADVLAYSNDAVNVANTIHAALVEGGKAIVVSADENKRYGVADFPEALRDAGLEVIVSRCKMDSHGRSKCTSTDIDEISVQMLQQTVGFDILEAGYNYVVFHIDKPLASQ